MFCGRGQAADCSAEDGMGRFYMVMAIIAFMTAAATAADSMPI